jgi:hypothetical protein
MPSGMPEVEPRIAFLVVLTLEHNQSNFTLKLLWRRSAAARQ